MQKTGRTNISLQIINSRNTGREVLKNLNEKNANYFIKVYTYPVESRDIIKKIENPALNCLEAKWESKIGLL